MRVLLWLPMIVLFLDEIYKDLVYVIGIYVCSVDEIYHILSQNNMNNQKP